MARPGGQETHPSLSPCKVSRMGPGVAAGVSPVSVFPGKLVVTRQVSGWDWVWGQWQGWMQPGDHQAGLQ